MSSSIIVLSATDVQADRVFWDVCSVLKSLPRNILENVREDSTSLRMVSFISAGDEWRLVFPTWRSIGPGRYSEGLGMVRVLAVVGPYGLRSHAEQEEAYKVRERIRDRMLSRGYDGWREWSGNRRPSQREVSEEVDLLMIGIRGIGSQFDDWDSTMDNWSGAFCEEHRESDRSGMEILRGWLENAIPEARWVVREILKIVEGIRDDG